MKRLSVQDLHVQTPGMLFAFPVQVLTHIRASLFAKVDLTKPQPLVLVLSRRSCPRSFIFVLQDHCQGQAVPTGQEVVERAFAEHCVRGSKVPEHRGGTYIYVCLPIMLIMDTAELEIPTSLASNSSREHSKQFCHINREFEL